MASRRMLVPHEGHPIAIAQNPRRVVVRVGDTVIADTRDALTLREATYPPVQYIPVKDVRMQFLRRSEHASYCPYKGDAGYFDLVILGEGGAHAIWTYEHPFAAVAAIAGHVAFYPDRVSIDECA